MIKNYFGKFGDSLDWPFNVSGRGKISDPFGDYDRDGVHNLNDCAPRNPKKQDKMMSSISKTFTPAQKLPTYPATKININSEIIKRIEPTPGKKYPIVIDDSSLKPLTPTPARIEIPIGSSKIRPRPDSQIPIKPIISNPILPHPTPVSPISNKIIKPETIVKRYGSPGIQGTPIQFYRDGVRTIPPLTNKGAPSTPPQEGDRYVTRLKNGIGWTSRTYTNGQWITRTVR